MTSPGGYSAGTIFLQVIPSFKGFQEAVRKEAKAANRAFNDEQRKTERERGAQAQREAGRRGEREAQEYAGKFRDTVTRQLAATSRELKKIKIDVDVDDAVDRMATLRKHVDDLAKRSADVDVKVDADRALRDLVEMRAELEALQKLSKNFNIGVDVDMGAAIAQLKTVEATVDRLAHKRVKIDIEAEPYTRNIGAFAAKLKAQLKAAVDGLPDIDLNADSTDVDRKLFLIKRDLKELQDIEIRPGVDTDLAIARIRRLKEALRDLAMESERPEVVINAAGAAAELKIIDHGLDKIDGRRARAKIDIDSAGARRDIDHTGGSLRAFSGVALGVATLLPLVVPAAIAAAGAIAAIGSAAVVAGGALGVLVAGFTGIGDAVKALGDVEKNRAKDTLAASKSIRLALKTRRDAEQGLAKARLTAAENVADAEGRVRDAQERQDEAARSGAERIAKAREVLGDVAEESARRTTAALRRTRNAEEGLTDAQNDQKRAQERLNDARVEAKRTLDDLQARLKGGALAERQALIDLFDATIAYKAAMDDGGATNKEKEQASIALAEAKLNLENIRRSNKELAVDQAKAAKKGVEGNKEVKAAAEAVVETTRAVRAANEEVADAALNAKDVQRDNYRAQRDAAQALAEAEHDAALSARDNAQAVAAAQVAQTRAVRDGEAAVRDATERLSDAQANYQEALAKTAEVGSGSIQKLKDAMGKLGPAGQAFAIFLNGTVLPGLRQLRSAIQESMLPGVTDFLRTLINTYGPQLTVFLGQMGAVLGDLFRQMGEMFTSPLWQGLFKQLGDAMLQLTPLMGQLLGQLLTIFAQLTVAFAPLAKDLLEFLLNAAIRFSKFLASAEGQKKMADFLKLVREVAPKVLHFFEAFGRALFSLGRAIGPYADKLLGFFTGFLKLIGGLNPSVLAGIVLGIIAITIAVQTILGISSAITTIGLAVEAVGVPIIATIAGVVLVLALLGAAFFLAYTHSETFRDIVNGAFRVIGTYFSFVWHKIIEPIFKAWLAVVKFLAEVFVAVFDLILKTFRGFFKMANKAWDDFSQTGAGKAMIEFWQKYVQPAWEAFAGWMKAWWEGLKDFAKDAIYFVVETVINDGLIDGFNYLAGKVGSKKIGRIQLPASFGSQDGDKSGVDPRRKAGYATGGLIPGFSPTPTADNIPAWLTAGEYVLPVNAVRRLRAMYGDGFLEQLRRGMPGYATGGLVAFGRELQRRGFRVSEHPAFGGVHPVHSKNSRHYSNQAIDVNFGPPGTSLFEKHAIDGILALAKQYGLRTIWQTKGHYDHAHFDTAVAADIVGTGSGGLWDSIKDAAGAVVGAPVRWLMGKVGKLFGKLNDNAFGQILIGAAKTAVTALGNKLLGIEAGDENSQLGADAATGPVVDMVRNAAASRGWGEGSQWEALRWIIQKESGFDPLAKNPGSTAFGLFQFLDSTWAGTGFSKTSDPVVQAAAGMRYIADRYGDPVKAKAFHESHGYYSRGGEVDGPPTLYDTGGWLQPGLTTVLNASGRPEPVFSAQQWEKIERGGVGGGGDTITISTQTVSTAQDIAHEVMFAKRVISRGGVHGYRKAP